MEQNYVTITLCTAWMDNIKTWTGLPVEESIRMTEDTDKWRKYVHAVANSRIENGERTEQNTPASAHSSVFNLDGPNWFGEASRPTRASRRSVHHCMSRRPRAPRINGRRHCGRARQGAGSSHIPPIAYSCTSRVTHRGLRLRRLGEEQCAMSMLMSIKE